MHRFELYQRVTVIDPTSPFYYWGGTIQQQTPETPNHYVVKCSYMGWGENVLYLTFREDQLKDSK